jgi:hypothetical protein
MAELVEQVGALVETAKTALAGTGLDDTVADIERRIHEPLRVAIAGKVKAGKSTLLNALVGEQLAPTDAGECTRVVTWYQDGLTYRVTIEPRDGDPRPARFSRHAGALDVSLDGLAPDAVDRLVVEWPSAALRGMTIIDTPGIGSASTADDVAAAFLAPDGDADRPADAVVYLMRHLHPTDTRFLEAFHDRDVAEPTPVNTVGVLSRADEMGVGRPDALVVARRIAASYQRDPALRRLCQTVVPVAGLLGEAATTLREDEFRAIGRVAELDEEERENLLLSADRFRHRRTSALLAEAERVYLVERLGLFGVRVAVELVRSGVDTAPKLAAELAERSGVPELRRVLTVRLAARSDLLKARAGLLAVQALLGRAPASVAEKLQGEVERVIAGAHELLELSTLNALWSGTAGVDDGWVEEAERLLGGRGADVSTRLELPPEATSDEIRAELTTAHGRWTRRAAHPLTSRAASSTATVVVRSCEGMLAALA